MRHLGRKWMWLFLVVLVLDGFMAGLLTSVRDGAAVVFLVLALMIIVGLAGDEGGA